MTSDPGQTVGMTVAKAVTERWVCMSFVGTTLAILAQPLLHGFPGSIGLGRELRGHRLFGAVTFLGQG